MKYVDDCPFIWTRIFLCLILELEGSRGNNDVFSLVKENYDIYVFEMMLNINYCVITSIYISQKLYVR